MGRGEGSSIDKGTIFCKSSSLEWKEGTNWKINWGGGKRPPFVEFYQAERCEFCYLFWEAICIGNKSSSINTEINLRHGSSSCA